MKLKLTKLRLTKQQWKNVGYFLIILAIAPFAMEVVILADFVGMEFAVTFMLLYFKTAYEDMIQRWWQFKQRFANGFDEIVDVYFFQPKAYGISAIACSAVILLTGTTLVACAVWLPAMLATGGYG